ncbi:MAG: hypothetical protein EU549_02810 [Promethearchaeota archaeon]|nr:MAG: hypothetical protein EU549_02810 [Candidatus Lokiarchaeota archaeon]
MNLDNIIMGKKRINGLIRKIENRTDKTDYIKELKKILSQIKSNPDLLEKYSDIYEEANDVIMLYTSSGPKTCAYDSHIKKSSKKY